MFTDIISIVIVIGLLQGGLLTLLMFIQKDRKANRYLAGILVFLFWTQLEFLFVRNRIEFNFILLFATRLGSWLVLGPLFFFYTQALLNSKFKLKLIIFPRIIANPEKIPPRTDILGDTN